MARASRRYISGLSKLDDRLLIILDIEKLFDAGELEVEADAPAAGLLEATGPPFTESGT